MLGVNFAQICKNLSYFGRGDKLDELVGENVRKQKLSAQTGVLGNWMQCS